jgi:hypothetical protein
MRLISCQSTQFGFWNFHIALMTLAHAHTNYHVSQLSNRNQKILTYSKIDTLIIYHRDMLSIMAICTASVQMTNKPVELFYQNPIRV